MQWLIKNSTVPASLADLKKILLQNRQIIDEKTWFSPPHPRTITSTDLGISEVGLTTALELLTQVKANDTQIVIFGDYDADGISATAILWRVLYNLGFKVTPFIPDRLNHGYGLTTLALEEIFAAQVPGLVITVDNGIVAHEAVTYLKEKNCQVIITDHHEPEATLPDADAIIHSTALCGASIAWIFAREVAKHIDPAQESVVEAELDLCGIATIADQMPLTAFNRSFAAHGIKALRTSHRLGLLELIKLTATSQPEIDSSTINYALAPRINAMGRLKNGLSALRLLCTKNKTQAETLAAELMNTNIKRQDLTTDQVSEAQTQAQSQLQENLLIVASPNFHEGIIGLIAGRIMEEFHKPVIAVSLGEKTAKASARSLPGIDIIELIREVKTDLLAAGGHPMAAGFSLEVAKLELVTTKLQALAKKIPPTLFEKSLEIECILPPNLLDQKTVEMINIFEPFGTKNRPPLFGLEKLKLKSIQTMGKKNEHLRLTVSDHNDQVHAVVAWKQGTLAETLPNGCELKIVGQLSLNVWKNKTSLQIMATNIKRVS